MSALQNLQNIDWKKLTPEFSGETWLVLNSGKSKNLKDAKNWGEIATCTTNEQFDGYVKTLSLEQVTEGNESDWHEALGVECIDVDYRCSRSGFEEGDQEEISRDEINESLLSQCSFVVQDLVSLLRNSFATLFDYGTKKSSSTCHKAFTKLIADIETAREAGATEDEVMTLVEKRLGKYFPAVLKKHERLKAMKQAALVKQPVRGMKPAQQDLFETETV